MAVERWYDFPEFGGFLGNVGCHPLPLCGALLKAADDETEIAADHHSHYKELGDMNHDHANSDLARTP